MKKFLLIVMVMLSLQGFSQKYRIAHLYSADGMEVWDYNYSDATSANLVSIDELELFDVNAPKEYIDSLFYDDRGNITKLATWQTYEGEWIFPCYVEYTYNEQNLRATRKNYNNFDGKWELGGIQTYYYDEEGKMTEWIMAFDGVEV